MYGLGGVGLSEVQISISELSVVGGWWWVGGRDKRTSWSDLVGVRQIGQTFHICLWSGPRGLYREGHPQRTKSATFFRLCSVYLTAAELHCTLCVVPTFCGVPGKQY